MRTPKPPEIDVGEVVTEVAALLRSGASTPEAWAQTLAQHPADSPWAAAGQQIAAGTSVDAALRDLASDVKYPGALLGAAAGCRLATELGSSAADVLDECVETVTELQNAASERDRKSTRLNSSHVAISYAVFCLKKKKQLPLVYQNVRKCIRLTPKLMSP